MPVMSTKTQTNPKRAAPDAHVSDAEMDRYLADHHGMVAKKLAKARESIARGDVAPLEPLSVLLREARRNAKAKR